MYCWRFQWKLQPLRGCGSYISTTVEFKEIANINYTLQRLHYRVPMYHGEQQDLISFQVCTLAYYGALNMFLTVVCTVSNRWSLDFYLMMSQKCYAITCHGSGGGWGRLLVQVTLRLDSSWKLRRPGVAMLWWPTFLANDKRNIIIIIIYLF